MRRTGIALIGIVALLGAACSSGEGTAPSPSVVDTSSESPSPAGAPASVEVGQEFWFAGFHITLGTATFDPAGEFAPEVTIEGEFENLGSLTRSFDGTPTLASGGLFYETAFTQDVPNVPGLATGAGAFRFEVDPAFTFAGAVLTIGLASNNQAIIPLDGAGEPVALEPESFAATGTTKAGVLSIELLGGELRADVLKTYDQIEAGSLSLVLDINVTNVASYQGGFAFSRDNLALELPDGITVAPDDGPIELLQTGTTLPDQQVRFTIPAPVEGAYGLLLIDNTNDKRKALSFEIS